MRIKSPGHAFFALTMIGLGIIGLVTGGFPPVWSGVPKSFPAREAVAYLCAIVSLLTGIGLLLERTAATASRVLLAYLLLWMLAVRIPPFFVAPTAVGTWWSSGDTAVMIGAAWVLYVWFAGGKGLRVAAAVYGAGLIPFGLAHFLYLKETVADVPKWMPGPAVFWAYFTGAAFIAAGLALLAGVLARWAAALSALMMGLFTLLIWVPIVLTFHPSASDWAEFLNSWALTAGGWMVADVLCSQLSVIRQTTDNREQTREISSAPSRT